MHVHIYVKHITITDIGNYMHSYHGLIQILMLILYNGTRRYYAGSLYGSTRRYYWTYTYITGLIFIRVSRRSYRAYSYSEILVGITDQNDTPSFPLIHYSGYYHIIMGIPRPVLIKV